jgi:hypothetical protein
LVAAFVIGAAALPVWAFLVLAQTPAANASISLSSTSEGRTTIIRGVTDLPAGSEVAVQLIHLDEYDRARSQGALVEPSPWILLEYATVRDGGFTVAFDASSWPSGRGEARAFFWMHPGQPAAAAQRFGADGGSLQGPNVVVDDDGRLLRVELGVRLP